MDVSIIIVNYNTKNLLYNCLESIYSQTKYLEFEVIVSDNGSIDESVTMVKENFPQVVIIENKVNLGFGAANNRAIKIAKGKFLLFLNSDTYLLNNAVLIFFKYWIEYEGEDYLGALGANLIDNEGNYIHSYDNFPSLSENISELIKVLLIVTLKCILRTLKIEFRSKSKNNFTKKKLGEVDYITGADLFVQNDEYSQFDEYFFLYYEEVDLQYKMKQNDKIRILIDGPRIIHNCGGSNPISNNDILLTFSIMQNNISRIKYFKKNRKNKMSYIILKILTIFIYINPILYAKSKEYIKTLTII